MGSRMRTPRPCTVKNRPCWRKPNFGHSLAAKRQSRILKKVRKMTRPKTKRLLRRRPTRRSRMGTPILKKVKKRTRPKTKRLLRWRPMRRSRKNTKAVHGKKQALLEETKFWPFTSSEETEPDTKKGG